ncbi:hypothetical protein [Allosphingosinicella vermicomposti]|uniref:hypothetical protein n=1 Tax=Allosphingosinicella vermicomposti TaxID=614671 RepID=UPI000D10AD95|nr:hypothetical protein [Allosphingosinicella vermicomposti]
MELMLLLRADRNRAWTRPELVGALRGSDSVVAQGIESLVTAGMVTDQDGQIRYAPASGEIDRLAGEAELYYGRKPDAVRREIVMAAHDQLRAFSDAFKLRRD